MKTKASKTRMVLRTGKKVWLIDGGWLTADVLTEDEKAQLREWISNNQK